MLQINDARFIKSATKPEQFPKSSIPEFAFFGRSNAGKSSLINMLLNRTRLAKVGATPGMTQTVNFFLINEKSNPFYLVDLPGYGYAKLKKTAVQNIDKMLSDYVFARENIRQLFLLQDIRRPPSAVESDIIRFFLAQGIDTALVATKADKVSTSERTRSQKELAAYYGLGKEKVIAASALKKTGRESLLRILEQNLKEAGTKSQPWLPPKTQVYS